MFTFNRNKRFVDKVDVLIENNFGQSLIAYGPATDYMYKTFPFTSLNQRIFYVSAYIKNDKYDKLFQWNYDIGFEYTSSSLISKYVHIYFYMTI